MSNNSSNDPDQTGQVEVRSFKALPRDPNQPEHKKPRVFIHRPDEASEAAEEARANQSLLDTVKSVRLEDFKRMHKLPCFREGFLPGIGGGLMVMALRFMAGGSFTSAYVWGYGGFCGITFISLRSCLNQRGREKEGIRKAVQVLDQKQALREAQEREKGMAPAGTDGALGRPVKPPQGQASAQPPNQPQSEEKKPTPFWSTFKFW